MTIKYIVVRRIVNALSEGQQVFAGWAFKHAVWVASDSECMTVVLFKDQSLADSQRTILDKEDSEHMHYVVGIEVNGNI